jgi:hypothetical protein
MFTTAEPYDAPGGFLYRNLQIAMSAFVLI